MLIKNDFLSLQSFQPENLSVSKDIPTQHVITRCQAPNRPSREREAIGVLEARPFGAGVWPGVLEGAGACMGVVSALPRLSRVHHTCRSLSRCSKSGVCCSCVKWELRRERT